MSKYTVSTLDSIDKLSDSDLLLVSRDNGDGTYSSVNVPFSVVADAVNESNTGSSVGNGTTDIINYFAPTTRIKIKDSSFYDANSTAAILFAPNSQYVYVNATITIYNKNKDNNHVYTNDDAHVILVKGTPAAGYLPKTLSTVTVTTEEGEQTFIVSPDLTDTFGSDVATLSGNSALAPVQDKLTFITCTSGTTIYVIDSTSTGANPAAFTISAFGENSNIANLDMSSTQRKTYAKTYKTYIYSSNGYKYIKMLDSKIYNKDNPTIVVKGKRTDDKTLGAKNTAVYTDELTISDDSAIYLYGSFTCD